MAIALSMPFLMFFLFILFYYVQTKIGIKLDKKKRIKEAKNLEVLKE